MEWYPENKEELNSMLDSFLASKKTSKKNQEKNKIKVHGVIVPHAGYIYSGKVAGKVYSLVSGVDKAVVIGPSHYAYLTGVVGANTDFETPLGKMKVVNDRFDKADIRNEHSITNQIPFLQKLGVKEVLALMVGEISAEQAKEVAEKIADFPGLFVFSSDLSHFLPYQEALKKDKKTIEIIEKLDFANFEQVDACGKNGLLILFHLCKIKKWKPKLIEYNNSGDVTSDKSGVVGYGGFVF